MDLLKKSFFVVVLILVILSVDFFLLHIVFPVKKEKFLKEINQKVEASLEKHPPEAHYEASAPKTVEADFKTAAQACLGSTWGQYQSFPMELEKIYKVQSKSVDIENFHLKIKSGEERRIHIVSDGQSKNRTLRFFGLDDENLPTPIPLTPAQRQMPIDTLIADLKSQGKVFFHQSKERWQLGNGSTMVVTFENKEAVEFQLFGQEKTLSCLKDSCQCL